VVRLLVFGLFLIILGEPKTRNQSPKSKVQRLKIKGPIAIIYAIWVILGLLARLVRLALSHKQTRIPQEFLNNLCAVERVRYLHSSIKWMIRI